MWEHWGGEGDAIPLMRDDLQSGTLVDWGAFAGGGRGFAIVKANDELELLALLSKYRKFDIRAVDIEPIISLDQIERALGRRKAD